MRRSTKRGVVVVILVVVGVALVGGALAGTTMASGTARGAASTRSGDREPTERLIVYGDALVAQSESFLTAFAKVFALRATVHAAEGSAPCDALESLADDLRHSKPAIVAFAFPANSLTECMRDSSGELLAGEAMYEKYEADIESALRITERARVPLLLVSPPASAGQRDSWQRLDTLYRSIVGDHQLQFQYVDAGAQIAPEGDFAATQRCLPSEQGRLCGSDDGSIGVRAADGVSFCDDTDGATPASPCSQYSSGAVRYATAIVSAARLDLDYLSMRSAAPTST